jgi:hypothetical protein
MRHATRAIITDFLYPKGLRLWHLNTRDYHIFLQTKNQNGKIGKYQMTINISNGRKIDQMVIKYTKIFGCNTLQNLSKFGFLV